MKLNQDFYERIIFLNHYHILYAITFILAAQFIFLNFHFVIGLTITIIAICSIFFQIIMGFIEMFYLNHCEYKRLNLLLTIHYIINNIILFIYMPFLIWTVYIMFKNHT